MRRLILVTNAALTTLWLIALIVSWYRLGRFDEVAAGVLAFNIAVLSLPAFLIGYWGYWLPLGVTLTIISLFLFFSLLIGSQFSH